MDTVDRFQLQERDHIITGYTVTDRDFVVSEVKFILAPWRFKVNLTRGACRKFVVFVSDAVIEHLASEDAEIARGTPTCSY